MIELSALFGLDDKHLVFDTSGKHQIHKALVQPLLHLQQACKARNIGCDIVSGFRSYARQLSIWNRKWQGLLPVRNLDGERIDIHSLSDLEKIHAILTWSALPGASRHHWGTDIDVYDHAAVTKKNWPFQLVPEEYQGEGPCAELGQFLSEFSADFGFTRPYHSYCGGIAVEPWHISYQPLAEQFEQALTAENYYAFLLQQSFCGKQVVMQHFSAIYQGYVLNKGTTA